jgi:hypothetical protein
MRAATVDRTDGRGCCVLGRRAPPPSQTTGPRVNADAARLNPAMPVWRALNASCQRRHAGRGRKSQSGPHGRVRVRPRVRRQRTEHCQEETVGPHTFSTRPPCASDGARSALRGPRPSPRGCPRGRAAGPAPSSPTTSRNKTVRLALVSARQGRRTQLLPRRQVPPACCAVETTAAIARRRHQGRVALSFKPRDSDLDLFP